MAAMVDIALHLRATVAMVDIAPHLRATAMAGTALHHRVTAADTALPAMVAAVHRLMVAVEADAPTEAAVVDITAAEAEVTPAAVVVAIPVVAVATLVAGAANDRDEDLDVSNKLCH